VQRCDGGTSQCAPGEASTAAVIAGAVAALPARGWLLVLYTE
jgi:hypothetical protein